MKETTIDKFINWCQNNNLYEKESTNCGKDSDEPDIGYHIYDQEILVIGEYDRGYFILKLLDFVKGKSNYSNNGIIIRQVYWDDDDEHWTWGRNNTSKGIFQLLHTDLSNEGIKLVQDWITTHTNYTKFPKFNINDFAYLVKDFVYKIDGSNTLQVETDYNNIEEFFNSDFKLNDTLTIISVDTKIPIITLEKVEKDGEEMFKFIVDITNKDGDDFRIRTTFDNQNTFKSLIQATVSALKEFKEFYKYANDLENCL